MDDPDSSRSDGKEPMHIASISPGMTPEEVSLWAALRRYLHLQVPLAAVLRRPQAFLGQGAGPDVAAGQDRPKATVSRLPLSRNASPSDSDKDKP